jgi:3-oxoacyl-[acyl-carrier protein] reductase
MAAAVRSAIVTGGSGGIGRAIAKRLATDGFAIAVGFAGNPAKASEVVAELEGTGARAISIQADVANATDVERLFTQTLDAFGRVDVVVNAAGIMPLFPISAPTSTASTRWSRPT